VRCVQGWPPATHHRSGQEEGFLAFHGLSHPGTHATSRLMAAHGDLPTCTWILWAIYQHHRGVLLSLHHGGHVHPLDGWKLCPSSPFQPSSVRIPSSLRGWPLPDIESRPSSPRTRHASSPLPCGEDCTKYSTRSATYQPHSIPSAEQWHSGEMPWPIKGCCCRPGWPVWSGQTIFHGCFWAEVRNKQRKIVPYPLRS
jgi:hypothetical protein